MSGPDCPPSTWATDEFETFYDASAPAVYRFVYFRCSMDHSAAVELTNDVFLAAWRNRGLFGPEPARVLIGIARRKLADYYRRRGALKERAFSELLVSEQAWLEQVVAEVATAPAPSPGSISPACEFLGQALTSLDSSDQQLLLDKYVKQKTVAELAAAQCRSETAIMSSLARARERLREALKRAMAAENAHERRT